jgi:hypothetical protein
MHTSAPDRNALALRATAPSGVPDRPRDGSLSVAAGSLALVARQVLVGFGWTAAALLVGFATKVLLTRRMSAADLGVVLAAQAFTPLRQRKPHLDKRFGRHCGSFRRRRR